MHIAHITSFLVPELGYQEIFLAREQARAGHHVSIITSELKLSRDEYSIQRYSLGARRYPCGESFVEGVRIIRLRARMELATRIWLENLEETVRRLEPDLVIAHGLTNLTAWRLARLHRRCGRTFRLIYDDHMVYASKRRGWLGNAFYAAYRRLVTPRILAEGDRFIAISPETVRYMEVEYGIPRDRIALIPLGVDHRIFYHDAEARQELRQAFGFGESHVVAIYAGKVTEQKGVDTLVEAALTLWPSYPNFHLLIVGNRDAAFFERLRGRLSGAGREGTVVWRDAVPNRELPRLYSAADFGVWPKHQSITQLEAAACGLPIIVTNADSLSNRVANGNGLTCVPGDVQDLARKMGTLLADPALRKEMGRKGRELIENKLNWERISREFY